MKAIVNQDTCIGCGLCISTVPEVFEVNADGKAEAYGHTSEKKKLRFRKPLMPARCRPSPLMTDLLIHRNKLAQPTGCASLFYVKVLLLLRSSVL